MAAHPAQSLVDTLAALHAALEAQVGEVRAQLSRTLELLFLTLLIRLVRRLGELAERHGAEPLPVRGLARAARQLPPVAPHAIAIALGIVPGWVMRGTRNRGMRPAPLPPRLRLRRLTARPPPATGQPPLEPLKPSPFG